MKRPLCQRCRRGRIEEDGYALDGRPQYKCGNCGQTHTMGHNGYDWDTRTRQEWNCYTCRDTGLYDACCRPHQCSCEAGKALDRKPRQSLFLALEEDARSLRRGR